MNPKVISNMPPMPEHTEADIRNWLFTQLPMQFHGFNTPQVHFSYLFDLYGREPFEVPVRSALASLGPITDDHNYLHHIAIFEYAMRVGLGKFVYAEAYQLTYRLGHIVMAKQNPEITPRILAFLDELNTHASD